MKNQSTVATLGVRIVATLSLALIFGCGADSSKQTDPTKTSEQQTQATQAPASPAIFTATLLSGATFDSTKVLESQPLALWFWAPG